jgi:hypothetical protein|tara:strand:- start:176 stop:973 length:798 start_codon:yes stop_codon:yes gene_type:complete
MRYLKRQSTNRRLLRGKGVIYDQYENIEIQSTGALLMPKGTTAQRPTSVVGQLRYNTTTKSFEAYEDLQGGGATWKEFRLAEPVAITQQNLGNGDDTEINFGILDSAYTGYLVPTTAQSVLVMVENVLQIPSTNYTLTQNPCDVSSNLVGVIGNYNSTNVGAYVSSNTGIVDFTSKGYHVGQTIVVSGAQTGGNNGTKTVTAVTPSHLSVNALLTTEANSGQGNTFVIDGKSSITSVSYPTGTYITFGTAVPTGKPVTVLHNFDK